MDIYNNLVSSFKNVFGSYYDRAVDIKLDPNSNSKLIVKLDDGDTVIYDALVTDIYRPRPTGDWNNPMDDETWNKEFRDRLLIQMDLRGISQVELSRRTGIGKLSIHKYVNGTGLPGIHNLVKIAKALRCSPSDLIDFI